MEIAVELPELNLHARTTVRLHPRYGDEPSVDSSKLGGTFLWPSAEPWPVCPAHDIPLVTVLQLRADDFPEMPFPAEADLFQMLWCPREHDDVPECRAQPCPMFWANPTFFWRRRSSITTLAENPAPREAYYEYVPFPCRLMPERLVEFPSVCDVPELEDRIYDWEKQQLEANGSIRWRYESDLSVAKGTKIGGWISWIQWPWFPGCDCGRQMEHLLTIATVEWDGWIDARWTPIEEQRVLTRFPGDWTTQDEHARSVHSALWIPTGLSLGDAGNMYLFVCRHCRERPIAASIECS